MLIVTCKVINDIYRFLAAIAKNKGIKKIKEFNKSNKKKQKM